MTYNTKNRQFLEKKKNLIQYVEYQQFTNNDNSAKFAKEHRFTPFMAI